MSNELAEIANEVDKMDSEAAQKATITLGGVVFVAMAAVGTYVVTKKVTYALQERMATRREMRKLYKESKKSA